MPKEGSLQPTEVWAVSSRTLANPVITLDGISIGQILP